MRVSFILFVLLNNWNLSSSAVTGPSTLSVTNSPNANSKNSSATPRTSLEDVYEDLSIVNRIINALALQKAALTGSVKHQEVVTEMLKVQLADFNELLTLSPDPVLKTFEDFFEHSKQNNSTQHVDAIFLNSYRDFSELLGNGNDNLNMWKDVSAADFGKLLDFTKQKIDELVECDLKVLKAVSRFYTMETESKKLKEKEQVARFTTLKQNIDLVIRCLENGKLLRKPKHASILKTIQPLQYMNALKYDLTRLLKYQNSFSSYDANFKQLNNELSSLNKMSLTRNISGIFKHSLLVHERIVDPNVRTTTHLTAGLKNSASEIAHVLVDVRSPWFQKNVARGKDVESLAAALTPIQRIAKVMGKFIDTWQKVNRVYRKENGVLNSCATSLEDVEGFGDPMTASAFLTTSKSTFDKCRPTTTFILDNDTIPLFEAKYNQLEQFFGDVTTIADTLATIVRSFNSTNLILTIKNMKSRIPDNMGKTALGPVRISIREPKEYPSMQSFFGHLHKLYEAQMSASRFLKSNLQASAEFENIRKALVSTEFVKMFECYDGESLDTAKLGEVVQFVHSIQELVDANKFNATKTYLTGITEIQSDYGELKKGIKGLRSKRASVKFEPVLKLKNPHIVSFELAGGMAVIREMVRVQKQKDVLLMPYSSDVLSDLQKADPSEFWKDPIKVINALLVGLEKLEKTVSLNRSSANLTTTWTVFKEAEKVPGIPNSQKEFSKVSGYLEIYNTKNDYQSAIQNAEELKKWDLDFASHKKALGSAFLMYNPITEYFDDIFGFKKQSQPPEKVIVYKDPPPTSIKSHFGTVGICAAVVLLVIIVALIGYGFTEKGKMRYKNTYLYYFPNYKEFERRWRYSLFLDRENGENALLDASREINPENVEIALKKGAYVNVYNIHGNTALHMATNKGFAAIVELLIRNGADRSLLNSHNKLPEQFIPENYKELRNAASFPKIKQIYEKHRNKNYRMQVPRVLATHMFHIFIEKRTEDNLTNSFMGKYQGITSEEPLLTTTHCVCKTSSDGILETDDFELLSWIFHGVIMVRESWMVECIRNNKTIREDYNFLIEHVRYRGSLYKNCILPWSYSRSKGTMPFLCGVAVTIVMTECPLVGIYATLIKALGGDLLNDFPDPEDYNPGSHPYLHTNRGPLFLIHDGKTDLSAYSKNPLFSLFTEPEFIDFLLKREIQQDTSPDPIPIMKVVPTQ